MRVVTLRCDRCDKETVYKSFMGPGRDWAQVSIDLASTEFCKECWTEMLELANVRTKGTGHDRE